VASPDPVDLTTIAKVKSYLGQVSSSEEGELGRIITAVSHLLIHLIDRPIKAQACRHVASGSGRDRIFLPFYPIVSINYVRIDGKDVAAATVGGTDIGYLLNGNTIVLRGVTASRAIMNVDVSYVAGYETVPPPLEQAALELIALRYRERERVGLTSRGLGGESLAFAREQVPPSVDLVLNHYRRVVPV
jgi:hypothetical protein